MKTTRFFGFLLLLISVNSIAQSNYREVQYSIKLAEDWFFFEGVLKFSNELSRFNWKQKSDSRWVINKVQPTGSHDEQIVFTDSIGHVILMNLKSKNLLIRSFCAENEDYLFEDKVDFEWEIGNRNKVIANLNCVNATTHFRGRDYQVWFTTDIPVSAGPWKFFGLPGLILEVEDSKKEVLIKLKELRVEEQTKIINSEIEGALTSLQEFNLCLDKEWSKLTKKIRAEFAQLQAESPDLVFEIQEAKSRPATELEFE